jgi:hypothetical protein
MTSGSRHGLTFLQPTFLIRDIPVIALPYWLLGFLILVDAGLYSRARGVRTAALGAELSA